MKATYRSVAGRIRQEVPALRQVAERAMASLSAAKTTDDDRFVDAAALNLHAFYSGLERLMEHVARRIDGTLPDGRTWHVDLLAQMASPMADLRPPVFDDGLRHRLDRYRGFRHVVRNVYTYLLDIEQIQVLIDGLPELLDALERDLLTFAEFLETTARDA
jgi:hypothetical protein